jgi:hypothetical protein
MSDPLENEEALEACDRVAAQLALMGSGAVEELGGVELVTAEIAFLLGTDA